MNNENDDPMPNDQIDNVSVDGNLDRSNPDDDTSDDGLTGDAGVTTNAGTMNDDTTNEPLIDPVAVDPEELDPLAIIKNEVPIHEEDIAELANDILREDVEFEQVYDDVFISVEGEMPLPYINSLQFKKNDELSGNRPCYDFVSKIFFV